MFNPSTVLAPARILATLAQGGAGGDTGGSGTAGVEDVVSGVKGCDGGTACSAVWRWTHNRTLADVTAFVTQNLLTILLIIVASFVALWLLKRIIRRGLARVGRGAVALREQGMGTDLTPRRQLELSQAAQRVSQRTETMSGVLFSVARLFVWSIAVLLILGELGLNLGPLLAGAGILGVALGFGAQSIVRDFLSGVFIISEDQFGLGDVVDLGEAAGTVERITLRTTVLRDMYGTVWYVPNGEVRRVGNKSQLWARALLDINVAYDADVDAAEEVLLNTARDLAEDPQWREWFLDDPEVLGLESLGPDAVKIRLSVRTLPAKQFEVQRELNRRIKVALEHAGIEIPFPQRTVWVRHEPAREAGSGRTGDVTDSP